ncbi:MAG: DUF2339 domain-containing protein [Bacteroidia bacterium]
MDRIPKLKKKRIPRKKGGLDRFLRSRLLFILGGVFLLLGLYFSLSTTDVLKFISNLMMKLLNPTADIQKDEITNWSGFTFLLGYFLPAIIVLFVSNLYERRYNKTTYPISLITIVYFIIIQTKIFSNLLFRSYYYPNFLIASVFLFLITILLLSTVLIYRKNSLLLLSSIFFFVTVVQYGVSPLARLEYLFSYVIVFNILIAWIANKMQRNEIDILNFIFTFFFYFLFLIRKFAVNSRPEFLIIFFTFAILFYFLFYFINLYTSNDKEKPLSRGSQLVFNWSNLLFFLGSTSYLINKYYSYNYLWVFVLGLLAVNVLGVYLIRKYKPNTWILPYYYVILFLAALVLPLLLQQNGFFIFSAVFSLLLLIYSIEFKSRVPFFISLFTIVTAIVLYFKYWSFIYFPTIISAPHLMPTVELVWNGIITGLVMLMVLWLTKLRLNEAQLPVAYSWFSSKIYGRFVYFFLLIAQYLTLGWVFFTLVSELTSSVIYSSQAWFIASCLFFILFILYFIGKLSMFKRPMLYVGLVHLVLYPLFLGWSVTAESFISLGHLNITSVWIHYIAVVLMIVLSYMTISRVYRRNIKYPYIQQGIQIITVLYLAFMLCIEYDNLCIIKASIVNSADTKYFLTIKLLEINQYISYSIILWILSVLVFLFAFFNHKHFLRTIAIVLFIGTLIKIFVFDFFVLDAEDRSAVFFALGIFLIVFALLYPLMLKWKKNPQPLKGRKRGK